LLDNGAVIMPLASAYPQFVGLTVPFSPGDVLTLTCKTPIAATNYFIFVFEK
jgi:hypothetical protein